MKYTKQKLLLSKSDDFILLVNSTTKVKYIFIEISKPTNECTGHTDNPIERYNKTKFEKIIVIMEAK
jgi:hypothetical protein